MVPARRAIGRMLRYGDGDGGGLGQAVVVEEFILDEGLLDAEPVEVVDGALDVSVLEALVVDGGSGHGGEVLDAGEVIE